MSHHQIPSQVSHSTETWATGTEVLAVYSFKGNSQEDLPFSRKEVLTVVRNTRDPNWYWARNKDNKEGMIPANYVQKRGEVKLSAMPWFHGKIQRKQAEDLLNPKEDGLFLVRESTNYPGDYTLCVCKDGKVEHYHVIYKDNKLTIDEEEFFENLVKMVEHYEEDADGLCTKLLKPLQKEGNFAFAVDTNAFAEQGWVIKMKDLKMGAKIGKGDFGDVYKAHYNDQDVAVKTLKDSSKADQQFLFEASVMTALRHDNLVQLIGVVLGDTRYIVTEFLEKGNLVDFLRSRGRSVITKKDQIQFSRDTCCGMAYLESKKLVHRDLAARNILIASDGSAKVSDFGLARHQDASQEGGKFPIKWTSPEALRDNKFSSKSDMWSFGILLWEIYSFGRVPYPRVDWDLINWHLFEKHIKNISDVVKLVERGYRMEPPDSCQEEIYNIMQASWNLNPEKRPSFFETSLQLNNIQPSP